MLVEGHLSAIVEPGDLGQTSPVILDEPGDPGQTSPVVLGKLSMTTKISLSQNGNV